LPKAEQNLASRPTKIEPILAVLEAYGPVVSKSSEFYSKGTSLREPTSSHFASKSVEKQ